MRFFDLTALIFYNLGRRKGRVALTAIGVVIGTAAVVVLVSLATGLRQNATQQLGGIGDLTLIQVMPTYGEGNAAGGKVVMAQRAGGGTSPGKGPTPNKLLTPASLEELAGLPGVQAVIPRDFLNGSGYLSLGRLQGYGNIVGLGADDLSIYGYTMQSGSSKLEHGGAIVGAQIARNFNDPFLRPGQATPTPPELQDKQAKLVLQKWTQDGQESHKTVPLRITGVIAENRSESDYSIYMRLDDVTAYNEWIQGRRISRTRDGYSMIQVKADKVENVLDLAKKITNLGFQAQTPQSFVQGINSYFIILQVIFGGIGAISLLVAAIGIANTMAMAILERTREIGLMKAVGATNNNVLSVFLGEAAGIGLIGGLGGVALGWAAGKALNLLAVSYFASQASQQGGPPATSLAAVTPIWLPLFALAFATLVGLLSGLYPALRAATLVPVNALKYE
ncbi:MAG TPA: ABC transporter permease [Anaerolineaceae bacterium]